MLSTSSTALTLGQSRPIKQGWILKKAGSGVFAQYKLKYLVLATSPSSSCLLVFEQCDQSRPAKYTIDLSEADVEVPVPAKRNGNGPVAAGAAGFGKKGFGPFILYARQRKFHFAAQTKTDSDDWFAVLAPYMKSANAANTLTRQRVSVQTPAYESGLSRSKSRTHIADEVSRPYVRDEDAISVVSSVGSLNIEYGEDGRSLASSSFETLSFCSEPVLTPQELMHIGCNMVPSVSRDDFNRRRKAPMHIQLERTTSFQVPQPVEKWNDRYQKILSIKPPNPDAALQKDIQLLEVIGAFEEAAVLHAMRMVDEHHLQGPNSQQEGQTHTKDPSGDCHAAPGAMFVDGMILHFACDYDVATPDEVDAATSRTSSELRSIDVFNRAAYDAAVDVNTALMVLIDYKGFRVVAYADMGIDERTIPLYDLRSTPLKCVEPATTNLGLIAKELNLKTHGVQIGEDRRVNVHLSASVQVYNEPDLNRSYAVNLFEIMPMDFHPPVSSAASSPSRSPTKLNPSNMVATPFAAAASLAAPSSANPQQQRPVKSRRLRPEFVKIYSGLISSDAFTSSSGCGRKERELNDTEASRASRYLRESWIPQVVKYLDDLEVRPLHSCMISADMHRFGVNVRYLGLIAQLSHIPYIRDMACIEMAARAFKSIFQTRVRQLMIHFKSVGATQIDEETKKWAANMFCTMLGTGDSAVKFFEEKLKPEIYYKYDYDLDEKLFAHLHKPSLFTAMQFHCGVQFEESMEYTFSSPNPLPRTRLLGFIPRKKHPTGLSHLLNPQHNPDPLCATIAFMTTSKTAPPQASDDERLAYSLTRHFRSLGPKSKLQRNDLSAQALTAVAAHYNATGRHEDAKRYAIAALSASTSKTTGAVAVLARAQLLEAMGNGLNASPSDADFAPLMQVYRLGVAGVKWNWGLQHPMGMALHDRLSAAYLRVGRYTEALEFHKISLEIALTEFGKSHMVTAGYLTKAGILRLHLSQTDAAIKSLTEALQIYKTHSSPVTYIAQVHSHLADALDARGDSDAAIANAQKARKLWEKARGQMDPRSVASNMQTATLLLKPYAEYKGVLTPAIKGAYREAITCYEKVFRYLKNTSSPVRGSGASIISSRSSTVSSMESFSTRHTTSAVTESSASSSGSVAIATPIVGPAVVPPFAPLPVLPKSILHKLTKKIVTLKLALVESPRHKEVVRTLRQGNATANPDDGNEEDAYIPLKFKGSEFVVAKAFDPVMAREVVIKMAAVSPSIYLDGVLARIDDEDVSAIDELAIAIQLAESETVGLAA
ncbi:translation initiation factor eIF3 subunit 135-domain-containing protein [Chytriomyces sp. MP71]|nr:translation initiation factor eIF3 subunit 135-domain-containing protein [Chytriomyces sp. MP71]